MQDEEIPCVYSPYIIRLPWNNRGENGEVLFVNTKHQIRTEDLVAVMDN
jgi:hypothetical protein